MTRILFICTGNICRSPTAEACFNHLAEQRGIRVRAESAGLSPVFDKATPEAAGAAREYGADLTAHRSRRLTQRMVDGADLVLTMTAAHRREVESLFHGARGKTFTLLEWVGRRGDIEDPYGCGQAVYGHCAEAIWTAVRDGVERLAGGLFPASPLGKSSDHQG